MMPVPVDRQVAVPRLAEPDVPHGHPYDAEIDAERIGWHEVLALVNSLEAEEVVEPGYALPTCTDAASWWVANAGADHSTEHLDRLGDWVDLLHERRYDGLPLPTLAEWQE